MSDYFIGEIRLFPIGWNPQYWLPCDGRSVPVQTNQALYALLGNQFGGTSTAFNLPDLRGRVVVGQGAGQGTNNQINYVVGQAGGAESVTVTAAQMPAHTHAVVADNTTANSPMGKFDYFANTINNTGGNENLYAPGTSAAVPLNPGAVSTEGAGQAYDNRQPLTVLNYCIATTGIFPSRP